MRAPAAARPDRKARPNLRLVTLALLALNALATLATAAASGSVPRLAFEVAAGGDEINRFLRDGPIAAHLVLRSGTAPRLLVAFPAGDSAVGLWFVVPQRLTWRVREAPRAIEQRDPSGRILRGIQVELEADVPRLRFARAVLSSVRVLREVASGAPVPPSLWTSGSVTDTTVSWARDRLDGAAGYCLSIQALGGAHVSADGIESGGHGGIRLRVRALTGEVPLTPVDSAMLLTEQATGDSRERSVLSFLSYEEKYLAGSWRFDTYFGRDTLMSLMLLAPVTRAPAIDIGIASVLTRLAANGEVAHEEAIGEYAILLNQASGQGLSAAPVYDYGMIDESFMLAPLAARALLDAAAERAQATALLAHLAPTGEAFGAALVRNFRYVVQRATPFARAPGPANLIGLRPGHASGNWRDSDQGLDGGRYPYDVNVALVPAALAAIARLLQSGLLDPYLSSSAERESLSASEGEQRVWAHAAAPLFAVRIDATQARMRLARYAGAIGIPAPRPLAALDGPLEFAALALDAEGHPLPVMHSDEGFTLLLSSPSSDELERALGLLRAFPAGLLTPIGLLVANPAYADESAQSRFTRGAYHGTVIWPWQQELFIAGLDHQLARSDLKRALRERLRAGRDALRSAFERTRAYRGAELWTWSFARGRYRIEPFAPPGAGELESDAAQLWSAALLGLSARDRDLSTPAADR